MPVTRNQSNSNPHTRLAPATASSSEPTASKDASEQTATSTEAEPQRPDSPENCSICLGPFNNKSFTSSCAHSFCFVCLKQWSKVKAECPLCKQPFTSIFHNIRSNEHYDIYELPHQPTNQIDYNIFNYVSGPIPSFAGPTHLFSLSQPAFDADLTLSNFSRFQFRHRRYDRYLNHISIHGEHPYSFSPSFNPATHFSATTWPQGAEEFRREVYRRSLGPPDVIIGCETSTYRLTPAMVAASAHRIHRIMPWLTRELRVLLRNHQDVRLAISVIQPLLTQVTIDSMFFYDKIAPLIRRRSRQFIQEFVAFANSALTMQAFDRKAMYRRRVTTAVAPSSSSSASSGDDVVEVMDITPDVYPSSNTQGPSQTHPLNLSRSGWDSPTPGPSWDRDSARPLSIIDRVSVSSESDDPVFRPELHGSDSDESKAGSDLVFVKYDKPWNERSPINLTSDSDAANGNESSRRKKKSKHKKKKKESSGVVETHSRPREKAKKLKSKHKDKAPPVRIASDEERAGASSSKRRHSESSPERPKGKKHKKSKKKEKLSDRELVDQYFAESILQQNRGEPEKEDTNNSDEISKEKDKGKSGGSSSKDKSKKRKKSRKHSRESHTQSNKHSYKKHPSGHKKSSAIGPAAGMPEHSSRHLIPQSSVVQSQIGSVSRSERHESSGPDKVSSSSMSHSVVQGFQPTSYLPGPETVQHIPVNLWVSAWPPLSVSHTYPPSAMPVTQNIAHSSSSSTITNPHSSAVPKRSCPDRLSISSSSTSSDSSDSELDDEPCLQIPSLQKVHSRTKQWLEANFPDLGRPQAPSSSTSTSVSVSSASHDATAATLVPSCSGTQAQCMESQSFIRFNDHTAKDKGDDIEVVSVPSDEDVVVCSSDDDFNSRDLWVVHEDTANKKTLKNVRKSAQSSCKYGESSGTSSSNVAILPLERDINRLSNHGPSISTFNNIILPSDNKPFLPFTLHKKVEMPIVNNDPFFPPMAHSSDEETESASMHNSINRGKQTSCQYVSQTPSSTLHSETVENDPSSAVLFPNDFAIKDLPPTSIVPLTTWTQTLTEISATPSQPSTVSSSYSMASNARYSGHSIAPTSTVMSPSLQCYLPQHSLSPQLPVSLPLPFSFPPIPPFMSSPSKSSPAMPPLYASLSMPSASVQAASSSITHLQSTPGLYEMPACSYSHPNEKGDEQASQKDDHANHCPSTSGPSVNSDLITDAVPSVDTSADMITDPSSQLSVDKDIDTNASIQTSSGAMMAFSPLPPHELSDKPFDALDSSSGDDPMQNPLPHLIVSETLAVQQHTALTGDTAVASVAAESAPLQASSSD